jgi:hypothetical protein
MGRKLEWELSGKSDVPEKMAKAKASMEGVEGASNALGKKFKEAFKDIALGFVAPMVLVQKALSFMTDQFEKLRQFAQESREFAKDAENAKYFQPGGREAILQQQAREKESEAKMKGAFGSQLGYADFLANDPRGKELMKQFGFRTMAPASAGVLGNIIPGGNAVAGAAIGRGQEKAAAQVLALRDDVRAKIDALLAGDIAKRAAGELGAKAGDVGMTASKIPELASNVIGVGMSPQLDIANKQLVVQEDMANSLRTLIERDQAQSGFTPEKFFPSSRRLNLPR